MRAGVTWNSVTSRTARRLLFAVVVSGRSVVAFTSTRVRPGAVSVVGTRITTRRRGAIRTDAVPTVAPAADTVTVAVAPTSRFGSPSVATTLNARPTSRARGTRTLRRTRSGFSSVRV